MKILECEFKCYSKYITDLVSEDKIDLVMRDNLLKIFIDKIWILLSIQFRNPVLLETYNQIRR